MDSQRADPCNYLATLSINNLIFNLFAAAYSALDESLTPCRNSKAKRQILAQNNFLIMTSKNKGIIK